MQVVAQLVAQAGCPLVLLAAGGAGHGPQMGLPGQRRRRVAGLVQAPAFGQQGRFDGRPAGSGSARWTKAASSKERTMGSAATAAMIAVVIGSMFIPFRGRS
jgi:hypothetical protein